jgi:predicted tellurium resistance membrane protein TerC
MAWITDPQVWIAFVTLLSLEIVLGIDNVIFIAILSDKLPANERGRARRLGLTLAMGIRILLLLALAWLARLTSTLFTVLGNDISGRDLILLAGGLFLIAKSTYEVHDSLEGVEHHGPAKGQAKFRNVLLQILALDIVFSLDSVITAVGMANDLKIMAAAMVIAVGVMLVFAGGIGSFVNRHPSMKILALSFLLLIGVMLVAEGMGGHVSKGYIYFAMAFSVFVEMINLRIRSKVEPVQLHQAYKE